MIEPQGPLPPEIYWRRRLVAGGVLVAVLALVVGLIVWAQSGGRDKTSNTVAKVSQSSTAPSTATTNASVDPSQAPSGGGTGGGGAPNASANPSAAPSASGAGQATPGQNPAPVDSSLALCSDNSLAVVLYTDKPTYTTGSQPVFTIVVTNAGLSACTRDIGKAAQNVIVRTLDGTRTLWSARDCAQINTVNNQVLQPQQQVKDTITWSGTTSNPGCDKPRTPVGPGSYQAIGKLGEKESAPLTFNIVAPAQP